MSGAGNSLVRRGACPRDVTGRQLQRGFSLAELLVVIIIIAILASIGIPAVKNVGKANLIASVDRQLLDDISLARLKALNERTMVYMVFVPPTISQRMNMEPPANQRERTYLTNLIPGQFTTYALLAARTLGDQPGQGRARYLTDWKTLPDGVFIATNKFMRQPVPPAVSNDEYLRPFDQVPLLPFPQSRSRTNEFRLPVIAFNAQGQLVTFTAEGKPVLANRDVIIPIAQGSIFFPRNADGTYQLAPADVVYTPPIQDDRDTNSFHFIRVNWLTGRAKVELPDFP